MKFQISWHEECLANQRCSLAEKEKRIARMIEEVEEDRRRVAVYASQIEEAITRGMAAFDRDRFGKRRKVTSS